MKRFIIALTAIMAVLGFTSCEKESSKAIVGTWKATTMQMSMQGMTTEIDMEKLGMDVEVTFRDNGSGAIALSEDAEVMESTDFTYSIEGDLLAIEADGESIQIPVKIDGKKLTMEVNGELMDQPGGTLVVNFVKK